MKLSSLILTVLAITAIIGDLALLRQNPQTELLLQVCTLIVLIFCTAYLWGIYGLHNHKYILWANRYLALYMISLIFVQLCLHQLGFGTYLRLFSYILSGLLSYMILPALLITNRSILDVWIRIIVYGSAVLSIFAIMSQFGFESFLGIPFASKYGKYVFMGIHSSAGILEHPNTLGTQLVIGLGSTLYLLHKERTLFHVILLLLITTGLAVSMIRGPWIAACVGLIFYFFTSPNMRRRLLLYVVGSLIFIFLILLIYQYGVHLDWLSRLLRLEFGLSGREILWPFAYSLISERPFQGYGFLSSAALKYQYGTSLILTHAKGSGFHNNFIDTAAQSGLIVSFIYLLLYIIPIIRLIKEKHYSNMLRTLIFLCLSSLICVLFVNYNIGGLRFTSLTMTMFLGLGNIYYLKPDLQKGVKR